MSLIVLELGHTQNCRTSLREALVVTAGLHCVTRSDLVRFRWRGCLPVQAAPPPVELRTLLSSQILEVAVDRSD